ncbi:uncharacterized protein C8A04DRAFT_30464 [Dichotomopilus funicola]|uniref:Uncharacterized protein n=1 Tax=Dichotomopilus funicola TaxID=1934379 RepID=A0AAN6UZ83_9PEZI|nr:hypothetical protein C8A04DRAFT_30464 [Dichotomopilus funicola]
MSRPRPQPQPQPPAPPQLVTLTARTGTNIRLKDVLVQTYSDGWNISHQTEFKFTTQITVQPSSENRQRVAARPDYAEAGNTVGLVQTLVSSRRVATYEGGGTFTVYPAERLPCIDGMANPATLPFYDNRSGIKQRVPTPSSQGSTMSFVLDIDDDPSWNLPINALVTVPPQRKGDKATVVKKPLVSVQADETFLITLWNKSQNKLVAQWTWQYHYTVTRDGRGRPVVSRSDSSIAVKRTPVQIPLTGPVAGDNPIQTWSRGWAPGWNN